MESCEWGRWRAGLLAGGSATSLTLEEAARRIRDGRGFVVLEMRFEDAEKAAAFLREELGFDGLLVEDAVSPNERPSLQETGSTLFLEVAVPTEDGPCEVAVFLSSSAMVLVSRSEAPPIRETVDRWLRSPLATAPSPPWLLHQVLDAAVDAYFPLCDRIEDEVDALEDLVFHGDGDFVERGLDLKRQIVTARRGIAPLRDVLNALFRVGPERIPTDLRPYLQDVYDHTLRVTEMLDVNRDLLSGILDAHLSIVSNNLNNTMRVLTVMATFLMTAGLIAGIYGMNFQHMPELEWPWGYPAALLAMAALVAAEWLYFRRKRWL
ncbi:MAG: magnesium/cobalt transporter CorA [Fimbriimonadaceae bacterium]